MSKSSIPRMSAYTAVSILSGCVKSGATATEPFWYRGCAYYAVMVVPDCFRILRSPSVVWHKMHSAGHERQAYRPCCDITGGNVVWMR